jgi:hypothetical protein
MKLTVPGDGFADQGLSTVPEPRTSARQACKLVRLRKRSCRNPTGLELCYGKRP